MDYHENKYNRDISIEVPVQRTKAVRTVVANGRTDTQVKFLDDANTDLPSLITNGSTYLPLRFIVEGLGFNVTYFAKEKEIHITNPGVDIPKQAETIIPVVKDPNKLNPTFEESVIASDKGLAATLAERKRLQGILDDPNASAFEKRYTEGTLAMMNNNSSSSTPRKEARPRVAGTYNAQRSPEGYWYWSLADDTWIYDNTK